MTVVRRAARRRWITLLSVVAILCAIPVAVRAWPAPVAEIELQALRERVRASTDQPYEGYAVSSGTMGLPELPRLGDVAALVTGTTNMRAWYAGPDRWRVDTLDTGSERGLYQAPDGQYAWDYAANQLTQVVGAQPARLPRAADLMPPDLARRLLDAADGDRVVAIGGRRVAGIAAAGLRITPSSPHTTVGHVDIWADPATGLPLQVELTGRGAVRPVVVTRFLDLRLVTPSGEVTTPPAPRPGVGFTVTGRPDIVGLLDRVDPRALPERLAGQARRPSVSGVSAVGVYGTGLAQYLVLPLPREFGRDAYDGATKWGQRLTFPAGAAALISTSLVSVLVVRPNAGRRTYLVAGLVNGELLEQVGAELAGVQP